MVYQERIQGTVLGRTLLSVDQYCPGSLKKSLLLGLWSSKVFPTSVGRTKDSRIDFLWQEFCNCTTRFETARGVKSICILSSSGPCNFYDHCKECTYKILVKYIWWPRPISTHPLTRTTSTPPQESCENQLRQAQQFSLTRETILDCRGAISSEWKCNFKIPPPIYQTTQ